MELGGVSGRPYDESSTTQNRELPQLQSLRIALLRDSGTPRVPNIPLAPLEPNASGVHESSNLSKGASTSGARLPTLTELLTAARTENTSQPFPESRFNVDTPPRPILPAFVSLRALERFPYSLNEFHEDPTLQASRKRRRIDTSDDLFGEHLQLPIPQTQKESRPPPFGPLAIVNGLNEPPPNAALLPPIESGSVTKLLDKPTKYGLVHDPERSSSPSIRTQQKGKREGRIEEILDNSDDDGDTDALAENQTNQLSNEVTSERIPQHSPGDSDEPIAGKARGLSRKNTRKWTEEETTCLLKGALKCGIGNWAAILAQPDLKFNKRSAANLKDRYEEVSRIFL